MAPKTIKEVSELQSESCSILDENENALISESSSKEGSDKENSTFQANSTPHKAKKLKTNIGKFERQNTNIENSKKLEQIGRNIRVAPSFKGMSNIKQRQNMG